MTQTQDALLIERTLERVAETAGDITAEVYETFFDQHPETEALFTSRHSMACGQMLHDFFMTLIDQANREDYLDTLIETTVADHDGKGVRDIHLYKDFMGVIEGVIRRHLGAAWPTEEREVFARQCQMMLEHLARVGKMPMPAPSAA